MPLLKRTNGTTETVGRLSMVLALCTRRGRGTPRCGLVKPEQCVLALGRAPSSRGRGTRCSRILNIHQWIFSQFLYRTRKVRSFLRIPSWCGCRAIHPYKPYQLENASCAADASRTLGYFRISFTLSSATLLKIAYEAFVRNEREYACAIWFRPRHIYIINILEYVQNLAARFISSKYWGDVAAFLFFIICTCPLCNASRPWERIKEWNETKYFKHASITQIKSSLGLPVLSGRRKIAHLCLFQKIHYNVPHLCGSLLLPFVRTACHSFNSMNIQRLFGSTNAFKKSFLPRPSKTGKDCRMLFSVNMFPLNLEIYY